ncbi:AMP-binding protein [Streptomyces sp. NPDC101181]|uniref:AMP-binding protein n=1 Tax=Streptomyces sp. NPDC101181 TaxID=3366125 RepID=UPI00382D2336
MRSAEVSFLEPFFRTARDDPGRPAVVDNGLVVGYGTLAGWASSVARSLAPRTADPLPPVGIVTHHSARDVAAILGVLAAGRAYVPLEAGHPEARLESVLTRLGCREAVATAESGWQPPVESVIRPRWAPSDPPPAAREGLPFAPGPEDPAYVLLTSGSTGDPKGVVVPHRAPAAVVPALRTLYGVDRDACVLHFHGAGGDTSLEEILPTLTGGATLVLDDAAREGFGRVVEEQEITVAVVPTGFWNTLTGDLLHQGARLPESLRTVVIGGEAVRADMLERWRLLDAGHVRLLNTYGSTETALVTHAALLAGPGAPALPETGGDPPIGRPLPHVTQRIGPDGELCVSGPNLALGYHGAPEATAARFVEEDGRRWYRTGDMVEADADGALRFRGRSDHQVKIRGHRVDLLDVEELIGRCEGVAAVAAARAERAGHSTLTAFLVPLPDRDPDEVVAGVRARLARTAPPHLVPSLIVPVGALEQTHTGKVDREATRDRHLGTRTAPVGLAEGTVAADPAGGPVGRAGSAELIAHVAKELGIELDPASARDDESGWDFRVTHVRAADGTAWILRQSRRPEAAEQLAVEGAVLAAVRDRVPVPVPRWHLHTPGLVAYPSLAGDAAGQEDPVTLTYAWSMDPLARPDRYLEPLARTLVAVHSLPPDGPWNTPDRPSATPETVRSRIAVKLDRARTELGLEDARLTRWRRWLDDDRMWPERLVLVHGDIHPGHTLVTRPRHGPPVLSGLLDWANAGAGDPAADFADMLYAGGEPVLDGLLDAYRAAGGEVRAGLRAHVLARASFLWIHVALRGLDTGRPAWVELALSRIAR